MRGIFLILILAGCAFACAYYADRHDAMTVVNVGRAMWLSLQPAPGDADSFDDRMWANFADYQDRERQAAWMAAYGHEPRGLMMQAVVLSEGMPNAQAVATQVCRELLAGDFVAKIEDKFPSIGRTDEHRISLQVQDLGQLGVYVSVTFFYKGFIHRGDPRKIINYGRLLLVEAFAARSIGLVGPAKGFTDITETAIITDVPNQPETARAIAKMAATH